ncbi:MAG: hypothetical protein HYU66_21795 [Armatimonadetes bacterium]|nr:hypothetical protein [Armatimonadota bacterium]
MQQSRADPLPTERPLAATAGGVVATLLGCLLLLLPANWVAAHFSHDLNYTLVPTKWQMLADLRESVDWLVVGDSDGLHGVVPSLLEQGLGGRSVNLCTLGYLLALQDPWVVETYRQRLGPPQNVVVVHSYGVWPRPWGDYTVQVMARVPLPWGYWRRLRPAIALTPREAWELWLQRYVPLYARASAIQNRVFRLGPLARLDLAAQAEDEEGADVAAAEPVPLTGSPPPEVRVAPEDLKQGFLPARPGTAHALQQRLREAHAKPPTGEVSPPNVQALRALMDAAERDGFELWIANGPIAQAMQRDPAVRAGLDALDQSLLRLTAGRPHVHFLPGRLALPDTWMQSPDHALPAGAMAYSRDLVRRIRATGVSSVGPAPR